MAEEVGSGYVSLIPSMRNFSKLVKAELKKALAGVKGQGVEVPVTPVFDQKALDDSIKAQRKPLRVPVQLEPLSGGPGGNVKPVRVPVEVDREAFRRSLAGIGADSRSTIHQKVSVDVDRNFVRGQVADAAKQGGTTAANLFGTSFNASVPVLIAGAIAAAFTAPYLALAVGAAALAGAALGAVFFGAFLLRGDKDLQAGVQSLFSEVNTTLTKAAQPLKGPFLESIGIIKGAFRDIAPDIETFFKDIADSGGIQDLARGFGGFLKSFSETGALKKLGEAIGPVLSQIGMALPDIGNAISQFIITVTKPEFISFVGKMLRGAADLIRFIADAIGWIAALGSGTTKVFSSVWEGLKLIFNAIVGAVTANLDKVRPLFEVLKKAFEDLTSKIGAIPGKVLGLLKPVGEIPGKIKTALGNTGTMLLNAGKSIVQGLIDGIKSKFTALGNIMGNVGGIIYNYLQHSPAKYGPLSGRGNTYYSGQEIATALAAGVESKTPTVRSAASQMAGSFGFGSGTMAAAPAAAPTVLIGSDGTRLGDLLVDVISETVSTRHGGNVKVLTTRRR
jgi:phage-related protein